MGRKTCTDSYLLSTSVPLVLSSPAQSRFSFRLPLAGKLLLLLAIHRGMPLSLPTAVNGIGWICAFLDRPVQYNGEYITTMKDYVRSSNVEEVLLDGRAMHLFISPFSLYKRFPSSFHPGRNAWIEWGIMQTFFRIVLFFHVKATLLSNLLYRRFLVEGFELRFRQREIRVGFKATKDL